MKLKFNTSIASASWSYMEGRVIEVPTLTPEQQDWVRSGVVSIVPETPETTEAPSLPETAVLPKAGRRSRGSGPGPKARSSASAADPV